MEVEAQRSIDEHGDRALAAYRVVQEALRNVQKHSRSRSATVSITRDGDGIAIAVRDCGAGFDTEARRAHRGIGLRSMNERVESFGGVLTVRSKRGQGTTVEAHFPLAEFES